ncbi:PHP domain-containing protein [Brevibacillus fulvus]|uniref:Metal-dependent phosphoesterase TrpH n=1 Tax=Brevibacillus fulvus TaxID=1125967 RepID=A0A938Y486_9BACL|nr:PHP domain-containing protein [Brevibacillus fulvus]MBM7590935.1 putative metal-dependent phosphoesterase TrpH [Brevibacillus fulvus]
MAQQADLHTHTKASDGTCTPTENVRLAKEAGLAAIGICDHDTIAGVAEAVEAGQRYGVDVVPGLEISSVADGQDIHVLGYFIPYEDPAFEAELEKLRETRHERNRLIIERLQQLGIPITLENVYKRKAGEGKSIGRPHIAEELIELGAVATMEEAFAKYLATGAQAYVNPPRIHPKQAIQLIKQAGGVAVLAHPGIYHDDQLVEELAVFGLDGIEVWHPDHTEEDRQRYAELANRYGLLKTGGSDFHGWRGDEPYHGELGSSNAPAETVQQLRDIAEQRRQLR